MVDSGFILRFFSFFSLTSNNNKKLSILLSMSPFLWFIWHILLSLVFFTLLFLVFVFLLVLFCHRCSALNLFLFWCSRWSVFIAISHSDFCCCLVLLCTNFYIFFSGSITQIHAHEHISIIYTRLHIQYVLYKRCLKWFAILKNRRTNKRNGYCGDSISMYLCVYTYRQWLYGVSSFMCVCVCLCYVVFYLLFKTLWLFFCCCFYILSIFICVDCKRLAPQ